MDKTSRNAEWQPCGVRFVADAVPARRRFLAKLEEAGLFQCIETRIASGAISFSLSDELADEWTPEADTTRLCHLLNLNTANRPGDLEWEILVAMLAAPHPLDFPSYEEFASAINIRLNIVSAARKTELAFDTNAAERPADYWTYAAETGFTVLPGRPLIAALKHATQPGIAGRLYSFSCYRATEYVILLSIAQELAAVNPPLLERMQAQWETRAIMSGRFHEVFLREYGSMNEPLPVDYFVPGDRVWFRNPDERSSDLAGYEGSWVFYLGNGLFSNFWRCDQPYTMRTKCLEIHHWRHGVVRGDSGESRMDEALVDARVRQSLSDPVEEARILGMMRRLRAPKGVYGEGGCLDASREFPRFVRARTGDMVLPDVCVSRPVSSRRQYS